jgi:hypothetical protein
MEMQMTLAELLAAKNAATLAWIAEDPDNRWAGLLVEDLSFWAEMGVHTVEDYERHNLETLIWDMYKDVTGSRPRHMDLKSMSLEELRKEADYLGGCVEEAIRADEEWDRLEEEYRIQQEAEHEAWLAEQPEPIDYVACRHQDGWL